MFYAQSTITVISGRYFHEAEHIQDRGISESSVTELFRSISSDSVSLWNIPLVQKSARHDWPTRRLDSDKGGSESFIGWGVCVDGMVWITCILAPWRLLSEQFPQFGQGRQWELHWLRGMCRWNGVNNMHIGSLKTSIWTVSTVSNMYYFKVFW